MKENYNTLIVGERCVLVPYHPEHVARYHEWMQDPDLLAATASEPLSLREEYEMQDSWRNDEKKCTFIVLARDLLAVEEVEQLVREGDCRNSIASVNADHGFIARSLAAMVGDVNLFLSEEETEDGKDCSNDEGTTINSNSGNYIKDDEPLQLQAELDIMIAEKDFRRIGVGREAASLMMQFGVQVLHIRRFFCKIREDNVASLALFQTKLGFRQCAYAACFREVELELKAVPASELLDRLSLKSVSTLYMRNIDCPTSNDGTNADAESERTAS